MGVWGQCWRIVFILPGLLQAQTNSISGTVLNAVTGEPVKNAQIVLMVMPASGPDPAGNRKAFTIKHATSDASGLFTFPRVPDGRYRLKAEKTGFDQEDSTGPDRTITSGQSVTNVQIQLQPYGVIQGTVTDQNGEPVRFARIVLYSRSVTLGRYRLHRARNLATDDEGHYRIWNLMPGDYFLRAEGRHGGTSVLAGDSEAAPRVAETFRAVYSDGSMELQAAAPIKVQYGSSIRADFRVTLERAYSIRGVVSGELAERGTTEFVLQKGEEIVSYHRASFAPLTRRFEMFDVPSGKFDVRAVSGGRSSSVPVVVGGAGQVPPISIDLGSRQSHLEVPIILHLSEDSQPAGSPRQMEALCSVTALLADPLLGPMLGMNPFQVTIDKQNPKATISLYPGHYVLGAECSGGAFVRSVRMGSKSPGPMDVIQFDASAAPDPVDIVAEMGASRLRITCPACGDAPSPTQEVVAISESSSGPIVSSLCGKDSCELSLPPGEYAVYMFREAHDVAYRDPKVVASLQNGVRIRVEAKAEANVVLREFAK